MIRCYNGGVYYSLVVALLTVSSWISTGIAQRELSVQDNEYCKPRPTLVAVNAPSFNMFPYYVTLERCAGSVNHLSPRIKLCVVNKTQEVKVKALNFDTLQLENIVMENHTSCKERCKDTKDMCDPELERWDDKLCDCQCKYGNNPPEACPAGFKWNKYLCQCVCDQVPQVRKCLKEQKEWSNDQCGCVCSQRVVNRCKRKKKDLDGNSCQCVEPIIAFAQTGDEQCISMQLLFLIIIVEFILMIILLDICLYKKNSGVLRRLVGYTNECRNPVPV